jgi:hypothetical protein
LWKVQIPEIVGKDDYILIINGDCVEGKHHNTIEVATADKDEQLGAFVDAFKACMEQASKPKGIFIVEGTECHTARVENYLGQTIGATPCKANKRRFAHQKLYLSMHGFPFVVRHHCPASSRPYLQSSQLGAQLGGEIQEAAARGHIIPRGLIMAHRHVHGYYSDGRNFSAVTGAWAGGLNRYENKVVGHAISQPTALVLDWRDKKEKAMPEVHEISYVIEQPEFLEI